ncbi:hypothetical protein PS659_01427 [Pseudomonas fluorescens]|uniref:Uncharacterized protein n=2 Tax=Pseudomonas fluorescens TaxID=294 RepID=A0A5E6R3Z1_PSEFL|nr:hypothetical protein PS659_01427 [Pseudomonas fluorescens]
MNPLFFPSPHILIFARTKQHLPSKKVLKMSNSMGIASAFVLSSLFLSPLAMAEESQTFVAHNAARTTAFEEHRIEMTAKAVQDTQAPQASSTQTRPQAGKDS